MPIWSALILCTILLSTAVASDGPTMIMKAAEQAAYADTLIQSCHYDEAEHWIDKALHNARDTRSDNMLVRDTAGTFVGHLEIKVREFRDQRKSWERSARDTRQLLASNRLESARQHLSLTDARSCDPAFRDLFNEIERRDTQVTRPAPPWNRTTPDAATSSSGANTPKSAWTKPMNCCKVCAPRPTCTSSYTTPSSTGTA